MFRVNLFVSEIVDAIWEHLRLTSDKFIFRIDNLHRVSGNIRYAYNMSVCIGLMQNITYWFLLRFIQGRDSANLSLGALITSKYVVIAQQKLCYSRQDEWSSQAIQVETQFIVQSLVSRTICIQTCLITTLTLHVTSQSSIYFPTSRPCPVRVYTRYNTQLTN